MNYEERDTYGMYKVTAGTATESNMSSGPGPRLMGADTLIGNDVYNQKDEELGDIKEIMLDMQSGEPPRESRRLLGVPIPLIILIALFSH